MIVAIIFQFFLSTILYFNEVVVWKLIPWLLNQGVAFYPAFLVTIVLLRNMQI